MQREPLHPRRMPLAERLERPAVTGLGARHKDRIGETLVGERDIVAITAGWTALRLGGLHGGPTLVAMALVPESVLPRLRGSFGRVYLHALETPSTQGMPSPDAAHGTVAVAEHQTAGRGRLGRIWVDEPGTGLALSVVLRPPPPVTRWPELTLVAARAVAGAVGPEAQIKPPNDVLVGGKKVAGILAEAGDRVVLGIGVNIGEAPWPGAGYVERDRLELLVEILDRLEQGYDAWLSGQDRL
jgi:Biotin/lipoate A/B protein ligase family